jgi:hypothetical protein
LQPQAIPGALLIAARGKAEFQQGAVEQQAGMVAGERAAGAVGAAQTRREADNEQPRAFVAE